MSIARFIAVFTATLIACSSAEPPPSDRYCTREKGELILGNSPEGYYFATDDEERRPFCDADPISICDGDKAKCDLTTYTCDGKEATFKIRPLRRIGESCHTDCECVLGTYCAGDDLTKKGICTPYDKPNTIQGYRVVWPSCNGPDTPLGSSVSIDGRDSFCGPRPAQGSELNRAWIPKNLGILICSGILPLFAEVTDTDGLSVSKAYVLNSYATALSLWSDGTPGRYLTLTKPADQVSGRCWLYTWVGEFDSRKGHMIKSKLTFVDTERGTRSRTDLSTVTMIP